MRAEGLHDPLPQFHRGDVACRAGARVERVLLAWRASKTDPRPLLLLCPNLPLRRNYVLLLHLRHMRTAVGKIMAKRRAGTAPPGEPLPTPHRETL